MDKTFEEFATLDLILRDPKPVSVNDLYPSGKNGVRYLTKEGKHFKDTLSAKIAEKTLVVPWSDVIDCVYKRGGCCSLDVVIYFEDLYNQSWVRGGSKTTSNEARLPYKKKDATNYFKLIEDAVVKGTGIDDAAHLATSISKREDKKDPRIEITYTVYEVS